MDEVSMPYLRKTYYALALDPVHIGSGEMQMGRVDNPIVRDAASNLPKIPATSLAGVARTYTAMHYPEKYRRPVEVKPGVVGYASCADQTGPTGKKDGACGRVDCPVCIPYGFLQPGGRTSPSMVQTFDAFPLFFPAPSMFGPVWVTSPERLRELVQSGALEAKDVDIQLKPEHGFRLQTGLPGRRLNLGWLLLPVAVPASPLTPSGVARLRAANVPEEMLTRLVLVPDELFAQVVNNNLEVRTSTAIDRSTGAALTGALYTYEAIPRGTLFSFPVVYKNPRDFLLDGQPIPQDIAWVQEQVEKGLHYIEYLGIGGKNTRGMGRLRVLNLEVGSKE